MKRSEVCRVKGEQHKGSERYTAKDISMFIAYSWVFASREAQCSLVCSGVTRSITNADALIGRLRPTLHSSKGSESPEASGSYVESSSNLIAVVHTGTRAAYCTDPLDARTIRQSGTPHLRSNQGSGD
jgi:hypothetical protein